MALIDELAEPSENSSFGIKPYKSASEAYKQDVVPRSQTNKFAGGGSLLDALSGSSPDPEPAAAPAPKASQSNFGRGWDVSGKQLKQTAYGTAALIGDTFGSDGLKQWGLKGYKDAEKEIQAISKESDSFTSAIQSGEIGNWLTYSAGYLVGQVADMGAAALAGAAVGSMAAPGAGTAAGAVTGAVNKAAVQTGLRAAVSKLIDKEAVRLTAGGMAKEAAAQQAVKNVYRGFGATAANTFLNATQELGSIYGEAVEEAAKTGQEYSLGKVWLTGIAATAVDTWADSKAVKGLTDALKGQSRVGSIAIEAFKGGLREGLTEGTQTVIERFGAGKELTSQEAFKEYIDSAAVGILGGTTVGGVSGAVAKINKPGEKKAEEDPANANLTRLPGDDQRQRPKLTADLERMSDDEIKSTLSQDGVAVALYKQASPQEQKVIQKAVTDFGLVDKFREDWKNQDVIDAGTATLTENPEFAKRLVSDLTALTAPVVTRGDVLDLINKNPDVLAHLYMSGTPEQRELVRRTVERGNGIEGFQKALLDSQSLESGEQKATQIKGDVWKAIEQFANTQSPAGVYKTGRKQPKPVDPEEELEALFAAEGATLKEKPPTTPLQVPGSQAPQLESGVAAAPTGTGDSIQASTQPTGAVATNNAAAPGTLAEGMSESQGDTKPPEAAAPNADLPRDIRGVKLNDKNRVPLEAYFSDEIAALQAKRDTKTKTDRLNQLEKQALKVGFSQVEVDQMFGRQQQASQTRLTEPKVTRNSPPADPNANWSPTVTLDYGDYTIENDGTAAVYSLKAPVELSSTVKLAGIAAGNDRVTLLAENFSGERVNVRIRKDHIRLEKPSSAAMRDYEFDGSNSADLDRILGSDLMTRLDAAKPEERVGMVLEAVTQKLGLDNLERFSAEFDNLRQGQPAATSAKPSAKEQARTELQDALANLGDVLTDALGTKMNVTGQRYTLADLPDALTKVMSALIKAGYTQFKDAAAELMKRMRASKDWAPLADKVDQGMLLKAWNQAGGGKVETKPATKPAAKTAEKPAQEDPVARESREIENEISDINERLTKQYGKDDDKGRRQPWNSPQTIDSVPKAERAKIEELKERLKSLVSEQREESKNIQSIKDDSTLESIGDADFDNLSYREVLPSGGGDQDSKAKRAKAMLYRDAFQRLRQLLLGRLIGKKARITNQMLETWKLSKLFNVKLLDDSAGNAARQRQKIKQDLEEGLERLKNKGGEKDTKFEPRRPVGADTVMREDGTMVSRVRWREGSGFPISAAQLSMELSGSPVVRQDLPRAFYSNNPTVRSYINAVERTIRRITEYDHYQSSLRNIISEIEDIERKIEQLNERTVVTGGKEFRARRNEDARPGEWGYQDENSYDRFEGGQVFDKATDKNALMDRKRKLERDLREARESSVRGQAALFRIGIDKIIERVQLSFDVRSAQFMSQKVAPTGEYVSNTDDLLTPAAKRTRAEMNEVLNYYIDSLSFYRKYREDNPQTAEPEVDKALEMANLAISSQGDFFEGQKVASGLLADYRAGRITAKELEVLEQRGLRDGDFLMTDLYGAYRAFGMSPKQDLYSRLKHVSRMHSLGRWMMRHNYSTAAREHWLHDMDQVLSQPGFVLTSTKGNPDPAGLYSPDEMREYVQWKALRQDLLARRKVTEEMRADEDPRVAFAGFMFNRIRLSEARNPDLIQDRELREALKRLYGDRLVDVWYQDVATALRRRPSMEPRILGPGKYLVARGGDFVEVDPVLTIGEANAFREYVRAIKRSVAKEAEIAARIPYFEVIRNMDFLGARRDSMGAPLVDSVPKYDEVIAEVFNTEPSVSPVSLANEAEAALDSFVNSQGLTRDDIKKVEYQRSGAPTRGVNPLVFLLKDGRRLIGETQELFPDTTPGSAMGSTNIAIPEVMNAILKGGLDAGIVYAEKQMLTGDQRMQARAKARETGEVGPDSPVMDQRYQTRTTTDLYSPTMSRQQRLFAEPTAGRPETPASEYERLYVQIYQDEFNAVQQLMDSDNTLRLLRERNIDPETGEILTKEQADEMADQFLDSLLVRSQMFQPRDQYGNEMTQYGLKYEESPSAKTIDEAAARDAGGGGIVDPRIQEMSSMELIEEGLLTDTQRNQDLSEDADEMGFGEINQEGGEVAAEEQVAEAQTQSRVPNTLEGGDDFLFRRGAAADAMTGAMVQDVVRELTADWQNATNVVVLPSLLSLPEPIRSRALAKAGGMADVKGLYHEGTVYIFSRHAEGAADVEFTLFHEAFGHLGMRAVLGGKFDQFLETAYRTRPEVRAAADQKTGMPKLEAIDEALSDMAAANTNPGIVKQWMAKVISLLRENGFNRVADWVGSMTDAEVAVTLARAREAVRRGDRPVLNGAPGEIRFASEVKPPYEMFSSKNGKTTAYARYNPVTDTWAVFRATGDDVRDGYTTEVIRDFDQAVERMKLKGRVDYRLRSGLFIDDKIVGDLVKYPKQVDKKKYRVWDPRYWGRLKRNLQIQLQNEYLPVFEMVEMLEKQGRITPNTDVKTALMLYERRAGFLVEEFREKYVKPIMSYVEEAGKLGVTSRDIDRYLAARHTRERNNAVAKVNPRMLDGGSGLTYADAQQIIAQVESSPAARPMMEIARLTDEMGTEKIKYLQASEMITRDTAAKLLEYDHYVNLSGDTNVEADFDDPGMLAGGSKFNVKGKEKRAFGRGAGNEAVDVLARTIQAYEAALIRGQKNLVAQKVLAMIETNYGPDFAVINSQPRRKQINLETGLMEEVIDENYMARKDVMVAKVGGIPTTIEFKETGLGTFAEAIHGMVSPRDSRPIMEGIGKVSRFMGSLLTTYNPAFTLINFMRDVQTMYFNSVSDGRITRPMANQMLRQLVPAIRAAFHAASGYRFARGPRTKMDEMLSEMQREGGITYFADRKGLERQVEAIQDLLSGKKYPAQVALGKILSFMEFLADVSEIAPRLAAYKVVRDNGWAVQKSAVYSGEITVNFNMRGANKEMRQLFVFFNPAVQGSYKLYTLMKSPQGRKKFYATAGALTAFGFLVSLLGRAFSGEDDDGIDRLDKVPVYKRATSTVLVADAPLGAPVPIPYGWNAFYAVGVFGADFVLGKQTLATTASRIAKVAFEAFSPVGSGAVDAKSPETMLLKAAAPTVLLPGVELLANENRFGAPIFKEQSPFDPAKTPDAQQYFRGVSPISRAITDGLTSLTGGNKLKAGAIDVNPATIDFLIQSYLPGLPSDVYKGASVGIRAARGEEIKRAPWPVVDRLSARIPTGYDAGAFRRAAELVETVYKEYNNTRDQERRAQIREEYPRIGYAHAQISTTRSQLRDIRKRMTELEERKGLSDEQRVTRMNELAQRETEIFKRATRRLMEAGDPVRQAMLANE